MSVSDLLSARSIRQGLWVSLSLGIICLLAAYYLDTELAWWTQRQLIASPHAWIPQVLGWLNHRYENWLNILLMVSVQLMLIFSHPPAQRRPFWIVILYSWAFFQLGILAQHGIFQDCLHIRRLSPSYALQPWVRLADLLHSPHIHDASPSSFPSGHAFVLGYWACFNMLISPKPWRIPIICLAVVMSLPRLFGGGHWLSDILFGFAVGTLWFVCACASWRGHKFVKMPFSLIHNRMSKRST